MFDLLEIIQNIIYFTGFVDKISIYSGFQFENISLSIIKLVSNKFIFLFFIFEMLIFINDIVIIQ